VITARGIGPLFFLSGAAGLLYEVVWVRALGLIVGGEAVASQAVLSAYFTGMALGAWAPRRRLDRAASPLAAYAVLELGAALAGLYSLAALALGSRIVPHLTTGVSGPRLGIVAFAVALVAFLPATFCMGATLPVLVRSSIGTVADTPRALGRLYAFNTLGAVVGAVSTGFALLASIGARATVGVAATLNLVAAVGAWRLARGRSTAPAPQAVVDAAAVAAPEDVHRRARRLTLAALGLSGFAAISYEIAAIRVLAATFDSTVYSFAATLGAYLLGISLAGALAARFPGLGAGSQRPALIAGAAALTLALAGHLLRLAGPLHAALIDAFDEGWPGTMAAEVVTALLLVLPAAVPTTLVFCVLAARTVRSTARAASDTAAAAMASTVGCALAPVVAGLAITPLDGSRGAVRAAVIALGAAVPLATAAATSRSRGKDHRTPFVPAPFALAVLGAAAAVILPPRLYGWTLQDGHKLVLVREGAAATVAVEERAGGRLLRTGNQYFEGGEGSAFGEKRQGHLPMLLHPAPRRALVLGLGTGTTAGGVARHPGVKVDGVELLAEVLDVLPYFRRANGNIGASPAASLHHADARAFVRAAAARGRTYDVIVADLYHPQQSGVGNLYTREHFIAVRGALAPGGLFMQWLSLYELPPEDLAVIIRTFLDVFPAASGWYAHFNAQTGILGLAGGMQPLGLIWDTVLPRISDEATRAVIADTLLDRPMELFGSFVTNRAELAKLAGPAGPLNTDDRPLVEYGVPRRHIKTDMAHRLRSLDAVMTVRALPDEATLDYGPDPALRRARRETLAAHQTAIDAFIRGQRATAVGDGAGAAAAYQTGYLAAPDFRGNYYVLRDLGAEHARAGRTAEAAHILRWLAAREPDNPEPARLLQSLGNP